MLMLSITNISFDVLSLKAFQVLADPDFNTAGTIQTGFD